MTQVQWGDPAAKQYDVGTDHGVLYLEAGAIPWNGLQAVQENLVGGEAERLYYDGDLYFVLVGRESYQAQVNAMYWPSEFDEYVGRLELEPGVFATRQHRPQFDFSYRSLLGDESNPDLGWKLHLVWNAIALPTVVNRASIQATTEPTPFSWIFEAVPPPEAATYRPTAHFEIESTRADPTKLALLMEDMYDVTRTSLPTQNEVLAYLD